MASLRRAHVAAPFVVCWAVGSVLGWGGPRAAAWVSDVSMVGLSALACASLALAARRRGVGHRAPFLLLSAACALWCLGEATWAWYELVLAVDVPFPSAADVAYLTAPLVAGVGLLALTRGRNRRTHRTRAALDAWLVAGSLLTVSWVLVMGPVVHQTQGSSLDVLVAVAYPVTDVMLATVALLAARRQAPGARAAAGYVGLALLAMAVADSAFTGLELAGTYRSGGPVDLGWVVGYLLLVRAGRTPYRRETEHPGEDVVGVLAIALPYLLVAGALGSVVLDAWVGGSVGAVEVVLLASLVLTLVVRQAVAALDNAALASQLALRERHYRSLVHGAKDVILLCGPDLLATYVSPSSEALLGITPDSIVGHPLWELAHEEDAPRVRRELTALLDGAEVPFLRCRIASRGGWVDSESTVSDLRHLPDVGGIVITVRDVSERTALELQLRRMAWQDSLTGIANRQLLQERLSRAVTPRRSVSSPIGLLMCDLDGFKAVNDSYGHATGDAVLVEVARRLSAGVRRGDTVARLGGDEFAILLEDWADTDADRTVAALEVADRLLHDVRQPIEVDGRELCVAASMGFVLAEPGAEAEDVLRQADLALYASKGAGRGRVTVYGTELAAASTRRLELAKALGPALRAGELELVYQPVVDLRTGRVTGAEALARWEHPSWGPVSPAEFIPVAESNGLIAGLGRWALWTAARQAASWESRGLPYGVAVNVSVRQLGPEFVREVAGVLAATSLSAARLTLEITESLLVDDERTLNALGALRALGVRLALDDFGTGWSSLSYLRRLPVHALKLDCSFVAGLGTPSADAVSRTVVRLASELGLEVIAEGVETQEQRDLLVEMGCQSAQGWLFGYPGPAEAVGSYVPSPRREARDMVARSRM